MKMLSDIEIAQNAEIERIEDIARKINVSSDELELYGKYKAKIYKKIKNNPNSKLILVTAINPTAAGEGKTTTSIGLADALNKIGKDTILCLREPSLGPVFGMKGGACGGGYAQVIPMEDINLHFTGDIHAVTTTHNLLAALIDNSLYQGNILNIDPNNITWKRVIDLNDRALREVQIGLGKKNGIVRQTGFDISVASEIMAILCLSKDLEDMKERFSKIIIGYTYDGKPVTVHDLKAEGAMTVIMKDAIKPNLVQTLEGTPTIIHGGPFANIAHGCNSIIATKTALGISDYVVTEAGFGADLGAEKFFDLKCRIGNLKPDIAVIVATIRALKLHGGHDKDSLTIENLDTLKLGLKNLEKHIENIKKYNIPCVVALNSFYTDTMNEINIVENFCKNLGIEYSISKVFEQGGEGAIDLAKKLIRIIDNNKVNNFSPLYKLDDTIENKILTIAREIYGANSVKYTESALKMIEKINDMGYSNLPICIAKTQYSLSDDKNKIGRPENFDITISEVRLSSGAGFIVCIAGNIMTMPGLPKEPAANNIDIIEEDGKQKIIGLF